MTTLLILALVGIVAVIAELVLPGGILGVVGGLCLVGAVIATYVSCGATAGTIALVALVVFGFLTLRTWMRLFHRLPFTKDLVLNETAGGSGATSAREALVGRTGVALTDLMPSGRAEIGGEKLDVLAESVSIERGAEVEVVAARGPSLLVRRRTVS